VSSELLLKAALFIPVGLGVGLVGSMVGVGGGFFIVPFLLLTQGFGQKEATAASLGIVFLGALSGTVANGRRRRIDYPLCLVLAAGTLPGALLGRWLIQVFSDRAFSLTFGALLLSMAVYLQRVRLGSRKALLPGRPRQIVDSDREAHPFQAHLGVGFAVCLAIGVISSLFGIGGGIILVPFLVIGFGMSPVTATAQAQLVFVFGAAAGVAGAIAGRQMTPEGWRAILLLGLGVVAGAQGGVAAAKKLPERVFRLMLSLILVGVATIMFLKR
jgi:uncharacterized membrane protein YfcA